jgi:hypothetical protein
MAIFKVGNIDYSNRVIAGSYNVQSKPVYTSWNDADGVEHRRLARATKRTEGTFDMFFKSIDDYNAFVSQDDTVQLPDLTVPCTVKSNTTNAEVVSFFFVDFSPVRNRKGNWEDYMEKFTVSVKEK